MIGRRIASSLFFAALLALLAWAAITGSLKKYLTYPLKWLGIESAETVDATVDEDVLFDDDSTVDWSDPATDTFDSAAPSDDVQAPAQNSSHYEYSLTPEYFNALLEKYSSGLPIVNVTASFTDQAVVLSGDAKVDDLSSLFNIPPAITLFLPETVPCKLYCQPEVSDGRIEVTVTKVWAGYDTLTPFLSKDGILTSVEGFLNDQITKYLPSSYVMQSAAVSSKGLSVRFSIGE